MSTHTRLLALFPGLSGWAGTRKVKPIWILLIQETVSGSGSSWAICKSALRSRQITMPAPQHSVFYRPDALHATQPTASKHWRHKLVMKCYRNLRWLHWHWFGLYVAAGPQNSQRYGADAARLRHSVDGSADNERDLGTGRQQQQQPPRTGRMSVADLCSRWHQCAFWERMSNDRVKCMFGRPCGKWFGGTHTHPFNGPFSRTARVGRYQKGKTNLDFTVARGSEWQWHQLGRMQVCISLQTDNHASTSPLSFLQAGCPSCRPANSIKALKAKHGRQWFGGSSSIL